MTNHLAEASQWINIRNREEIYKMLIYVFINDEAHFCG